MVQSKVFLVTCLPPSYCYEVRLRATSRSKARWQACRFLAGKLRATSEEISDTTIHLMLGARVRRLPWLDAMVGFPPEPLACYVNYPGEAEVI